MLYAVPFMESDLRKSWMESFSISISRNGMDAVGREKVIALMEVD